MTAKRIGQGGIPAFTPSEVDGGTMYYQPNIVQAMVGLPEVVEYDSHDWVKCSGLDLYGRATYKCVN